MNRLEIIGLPIHREIREGDDLEEIIDAHLEREGIALRQKDVLVIAQKIVSKAEGRMVRIGDVEPSEQAKELSLRLGGKDPREIQVILDETAMIVKQERGVLITEHRLGFVMANAGVDKSNVPPGHCLLLPLDPDKSAENLRRRYLAKGMDIAVIITDTFGRPWRLGQVNVAIGLAGMEPIVSYRGKRDRFQNVMQHTEIAAADEIASAAELVMGKTDGVPVAIVRGLDYAAKTNAGARELVRPAESDLFR